jgi:hypothetical protein
MQMAIRMPLAKRAGAIAAWAKIDLHASNITKQRGLSNIGHNFNLATETKRAQREKKDNKIQSIIF